MAPALIGLQIDRYVVEELLGKGGMGAVYRAFDTRLHRPVALKVLSTAGDEALALALREARAAARVRHPSVAAVFDAGEVDGHGYIVMELVRGPSLRTFVGDTSVDVPTRIRWLADVAHALAAAHAENVVHRDVKPDNVIVGEGGAVKVLDFGLARIPSLEGPSGYFTSKGDATLIGTPAYMAPEHVRGQVVDARADQFSWGVVAYELLRGALPWTRAEGPFGALAAVLVDDPEPLPATGEIPAPVGGVVMRALSKAPEGRLPSMADVALALEPHAAPPPRDAALSSPGSSAPPARASSTTPPAASAAPPRRSALRPKGTPRQGRHETFDYVVVDRLFCVKLRAVPTVAAVEALRRAVAAARLEVGRPLVYVAQIPAEARTVPPEMRPVMVDLGRDLSRRCEAVHLAVEAPGFLGAILRSAITGALIVTRERNVTIHDSLADALAAARYLLPGGVHDAVDALLAGEASWQHLDDLGREAPARSGDLGG